MMDDIQQDCHRIQNSGAVVHCSLKGFYKYFFHDDFKNHDALVDAKATYKIHKKLH